MSYVSGGELALLTGLLSGGFALLGAGATTWNANRRQDARFRRETALELAGTERLIWGDSWIELNVNLKRHTRPVSALPTFRKISSRRSTTSLSSAGGTTRTALSGPAAS
jgi:hypothetical protein